MPGGPLIARLIFSNILEKKGKIEIGLYYLLIFCFPKAWATAYVVRKMPKPTCTELPSWMSLLLHAAFAISLRSVLLTAIGRIAPSFLLMANRAAPQNTGCTTTGTRPAKHRLVNSVSLHRRRWPAAPADALVRSFRCCGRKPSLAPADPGMKDLMAAKISIGCRNTDERTDRVVGCQVVGWRLL